MAELILKADGVSKYFGKLAAVNDLSIEVERAETYGIAGPNGSGKTTLINSITHIMPIDKGEIWFKGEPIQDLQPYEICRRGIARTFQNPEIFGSMSVFDNLLLSATHSARVKTGVKKKQYVDRVLEVLGLAERKKTLGRSLNIGGKKKLMLGIALATNPDLLILDEPCAGLTAIEQNEVFALIEKLRGQGITVILIEHNMKVLMSISDRVMIMNHGESICKGTPEEICSDGQVIEIYLGSKYIKEAT